VVDMMLHDSPDLVIHRTEIWAVKLEATGWAQESLAFLDAAVQLLCVRGAVCWCTVLLEHCRVLSLSDCKYSLNPLSQTRIDQVGRYPIR